MNSMIAFIGGVLIGGLSVSLYFRSKLSHLGATILDKRVIIDILKEYTKTQDNVNAKKAKTKASRKKGVEEKG
jgi:hypothetical protein